MSKQTTAEYIMRMRGRYRAMLTKHARGRLLDEFCATTQLERKHAIKVLRSLHVPLRKAGRKPVYAGAATVLRQLWLLFASKLLHPVLASYVASYAKHRGGLQAQTKALLLHMSPSTMDRLLREHRVRTSLWRGHGGGPLAAMKRRVPVRSERWEGRGPGWFEADTVAHGGGSMPEVLLIRCPLRRPTASGRNCGRPGTEAATASCCGCKKSNTRCRLRSRVSTRTTGPNFYMVTSWPISRNGPW